MYKNRMFAVCGLFLLAVSCTRTGSLITDSQRAGRVETAFREKIALFNPDEGAFSVFDSILTADERQALKFIYAYAPLADLTVDPELYIGHVRATIQARNEMPWADSISEEMFLHFVLPPRVNNEYLDSSRVVFYAELKDRVKGLSLYDAALEVNHWCHEKVVYAPSDARTSSPLATLKTAYGRCGEESVFAVAALRAVGIPARQVYTPRWAHSDDNHAWVEVWGGDKWYYMGACEPDPMLDMGWFTAPATRSMLMHTKVYGDYRGGEEVMSQNPSYTEINVTSNYAPVKTVHVTVTDEQGNPVPDADVEYKIYNYAEFYPVARKKSGSDGRSFITMGLGDIVVWAAKDGAYGFAKVSVPAVDSAVVVIRREGAEGLFEIDVTPPAEGKSVQRVTDAQRKANAVRLLQEDSIRTAYIATFMSDDAATELAAELGLPAETVKRYVKASRGNYDQIVVFLREAVKVDSLAAVDLLDVISAKDLRDARADVLLSHFRRALAVRGNTGPEEFSTALLNPRIGNEQLTPYAAFFILQMGETMEIGEIIETARAIRVADDLNYAVASETPVTVMRLRMADTRSRNIFFVALARTYGYPARLEPATGKTQYHDGSQWIDVDLDGAGASVISPKGALSLSFTPTRAVADPKYSTHFTVSKIDASGLPAVIDLDTDMQYDMGGGSSTRKIFEEPVALDTGRYLLTTGTRLAGGGVLSNLTFFTVEAGRETRVDLVLRENLEDIFVIGSIDPEVRIRSCADGNDKSLLDITGRGYYILGLVEAKREPVNHSMRALSKMRDDLAAWGRPVVLAFKNQEQYDNFDKHEFGTLPEIHYVVDDRGKVADMFEALKLNTHNLPVYVVADSFGRVVFTSEGYQINLGDNLMKIISGL